MAGHDGFGLVTIAVGDVVASGFRVCYEPKEGEGELGLGHVMIYGRFTGATCRALSLACQLAQPPDATRLDRRPPPVDDPAVPPNA